MRISSYPFAELCPSFGSTPEQRIDQPSDAAGLGNAVHVGMGQHITGREPNVGGLAEVYGVDAADVDDRIETGIEIWARIADFFPSPMVEVELATSERVGHADVFAAFADWLACCDWKSGFRTDAVRAMTQVLGYLHTGREIYGPRPEYIGFVANLATGKLTKQTFVDADLDAWGELAQRLDDAVGVDYSPGDACRFCASAAVCRARQQWLAQGASALSVASIGGFSRQTMADNWHAYRAAKQAVAAYEDALRNTILIDGALAMPDGQVGVPKTTGRDKIDPDKAIDVMTDKGFHIADLLPAMSIAKGKLLTVYKRRFGRGFKQLAEDQLLAELRKAGAVTTTTSTTIEMRKQRAP